MVPILKNIKPFSKNDPKNDPKNNSKYDENEWKSVKIGFKVEQLFFRKHCSKIASYS